MANRHWIFWDGECGFCAAMAQKLRNRDKRRQFQICQFQHAPRPPMTDDIYRACQDNLHVVTADGRVFAGADAVFFVLRTTGSKWVIPFSAPPLVWPMRWGYWLIARNRGLISKWFFGGQACGIENRYPEIDEPA